MMELTSVHMLSKNNPRVQVECGSFLEETAEQVQAGDTASWGDLGWSVHLVCMRAVYVLCMCVRAVYVCASVFALNMLSHQSVISTAAA